MLPRLLVRQELWLVLPRLLVRVLSLPIIAYPIVCLRLVLGVELRHSVTGAIMVVYLRLVPGAGLRHSVTGAIMVAYPLLASGAGHRYSVVYLVLPGIGTSYS